MCCKDLRREPSVRSADSFNSNEEKYTLLVRVHILRILYAGLGVVFMG